MLFIAALSNLSEACKPALNNRFPLEQQEEEKNCQEAHCHGAISHTGDLTAALTSPHHILLF